MQGWLLGGLLAIGLWLASANSAQAQNWTMDRFFYYPYYYFPHNYWPQTSPVWPERPGEPYQPPPAYMAYPPFHEPHWRYDLHMRQSHYRGFHFWLDAF
jgi:hypothetical protein